jgi:hypothetical protein
MRASAALDAVRIHGTQKPIDAPTSSRENEMRTSEKKENLLMYRRFMKERDKILRGMRTPPPSERRHLDIAILEAWADGIVDDAYIDRQIAIFHKDLKECRRCCENVKYYKTQRAERCLAVDAKKSHEIDQEVSPQGQ